MPTISTSPKFCTAARSTLRPMRPKPLMPTLTAIAIPLPCVSWLTGSGAEEFLDSSHDVFHREAEMPEDSGRRRRLAEGVDTHDVTAIAHERAPVVRHAGLDRETVPDRLGQHRAAIARLLRHERLDAGHRDHAHG